jgi:hypothetical protein
MSLLTEIEYSDVCQIKIREVEYPLEPASFVFTLDIDSGDSTTGNDILKLLDQELAKVSCFTIDSRRTFLSWGASSGGHEIILAIVTGASAGVVECLVEYVRSKIKNRDISPTNNTIDQATIVHDAKEALRRDFDSRLQLELVDSTCQGPIFEACFIDSFGVKYTFKTDSETGARWTSKKQRPE